MQALFELQPLSLKANERVILQTDQLTIPQGKHTAIIGPNGAGKSTLLRALLGYFNAQVTLNGHPVQEQIRAGKLAFVAQNGRYGMPLSVAEYVKLGQFNPTLFSARKVNQQHLSLLLDQFELSHLRHKRINQLSGGEQQRANIVRALMQNAPVILLDEPCNHLDIRHQQSLMQFLKQHKTQFNAVMVLHDLDLAASYADHIILMQQGQIIAQGKVEDVMQSERLSAVYRWQILQKKDESGIFFRV
ncbi:ABC transporter ATP-binding protein [Pasteurella multocida subsp. multocida]|uniref:ABC transporter ATP-binding protein n=1 Tax=Pasteurella multocida TaxID=747 RepID=A0A849CHV0_PASMD|nr:ABC transporter ATP-binding protein [Pasteurella multocida]AFI45302.1 ABC transporter, ATP-binding protein, putative [Pasteurella multocida subsp. multocida str. 3480]ARB73317.1 ABC transporter ATP-binding protein [Pasteurella multocida]AWW54769.1 ABC transporter ATP-binding protein [Pasteurella multocida]EJZ78793.1 Ferrichrome transport ATP-binding protein FhuC [Pasteurella multocida subsp. gallicida X73]EPE72582.1 ABC transporter ATP-binding protein [Pasteurella multocida 671/90]